METQATHITSIDFDISKIPEQLRHIEKEAAISAEKIQKHMQEAMSGNTSIQDNALNTLRQNIELNIDPNQINKIIEPLRKALRNVMPTELINVDNLAQQIAKVTQITEAQAKRIAATTINEQVRTSNILERERFRTSAQAIRQEVQTISQQERLRNRSANDIQAANVRIAQRMAQSDIAVSTTRMNSETRTNDQIRLARERHANTIEQINSRSEFNREQEAQRHANRLEEIELRAEQNPQSGSSSIFDRMATAVAFGLEEKIKSSITRTFEILAEVEYKVVEITRVLGENNLNIQQYTDSIFDYAINYAQSFENAAEVTKRFAQSGYDSVESIQMMEKTLLALNTAELDVQNSTQSLIGIMQQWGLEAKDYGLLIDKINISADNFALTSKDLVDALLKSSSFAKNSGLAFDELVGVLVTLKEASGAAGREVGNAFKSILAYIQRPKSLKGFENLGIKVFANEVTGELLPAMEILSNMSEKWNGSSLDMQENFMKTADAAGYMSQELAIAIDAEEEYTQAVENFGKAQDTANTAAEREQANLAAGVYRRNFYISLMENFGNIQKVVNNLQDAEGYSMRENSKHMDTLTAKYEQFTTILSKSANEAGRGGLMDLAKDLLELGSAFFKASQGAMELPTLIGLVTFAITVLNREARLFGIINLTNGIEGFSRAAIIANAKALILKTTVGLLNAAAFGLASIVATTLISSFNDWIHRTERLNEAYNDFITNLNQGTKEMRENAKYIDEIKENFAELSVKINENAKNLGLTEEEFRKFNDLQKELISMYPTLANGTDKYGDSIIRLKGNVTDVVAQLDEYQRAQEKLAASNILLEMADGVQTAWDKIDILQSDAAKRRTNITQTELAQNIIAIRAFAEEANKMGGSLEKAFAVTKTSNIYINDYTSQLRSLGIEYEKIFDEKTGTYVIKIEEEQAIQALDRLQEAAYRMDFDLKVNEENLKMDVDMVLRDIAKYSIASISLRIDDESQKNMAYQLANFIDWKQLYGKTKTEIEEYIYKSIIAPLTTVQGTTRPLIEAIFDLGKAREKGKIDADKYAQDLSIIFERLKSSISGNGDLISDLIPILNNFSIGMEENGEKADLLKNNIVAVETVGIEFATTLEELDKQLADGIITQTQYNEQLTKMAQKLTLIVSDKNFESKIKSWLDIMNDWRRSTTEQEQALRNLAVHLGIDAKTITENLSLIEAYVKGDEQAFSDLLTTLTKTLGVTPNVSGIVGQIEAIAIAANKGNQAATDMINVLNGIGMVKVADVWDGAEYIRTTTYEGGTKQQAPKTSGGGSKGGGSSAKKQSWYENEVEIFEQLVQYNKKSKEDVVKFYEEITNSSKLSASERMDAEFKLTQAIKSYQEDRYSTEVNAFERLNNMGQKTTQEVLEFYKELTNNANTSVADRLKAEDALFNAIKKNNEQLLKEQLNGLKAQKTSADNFYKNKIKELNDYKDQQEKSNKLTIDFLEKQKEYIDKNADNQINALQKEETERDRMREKEDYYRNRATIQLDIKSAQDRSGIEARRAEAEAKLKLEELDRSFEDTQKQYAIEDATKQIETYRDAQLASIDAQIEAYKAMNEVALKGVESQIEALKTEQESVIQQINDQVKHWENTFNEANISMIAHGATFSDDLYNTYVDEFVEPYANGIVDGYDQANEIMKNTAATYGYEIYKAYKTSLIDPLTKDMQAVFDIASSIKFIQESQFGKLGGTTTQNSQTVNTNNNRNVSNVINYNAQQGGTSATEIQRLLDRQIDLQLSVLP